MPLSSDLGQAASPGLSMGTLVRLEMSVRSADMWAVRAPGARRVSFRR